MIIRLVHAALTALRKAADRIYRGENKCENVDLYIENSYNTP